tara:strand:- start:2763 stop:3302 length:540 start_codon:yes stop_codon:yes gene_type:complete
VNKSQIRKKILKIRKNNNIKNLKIDFKKILKILKKENIRGKILGGYYSFNYEVNVLKILEDFERYNYTITLPRIKKNYKMDFFNWSFKEPLLINKYGIPEPISNRIKFPDILLVPLVAYDKNYNRVGYGGGFYDRYIKNIKKYKKVITIGLAYSFQKVKKIPVNKNDIKLDFIITEKKN